MPRRQGWFLVLERDGAHAAQPVDSERDVRVAIERLAPIVPAESWWYCEWRNG